MRVYELSIYTKCYFVPPLNQWIDKEGKTPLIVACMKPNGLNVAKTLLELGANVDAYWPGVPFSANCNLYNFGLVTRGGSRILSQ